MTKTSINFADIEDVVKVTNGAYAAKITKVTYQVSKSGEPMWNVEFTINGDDFNGQKLWTYMSWAPGAAPYSKEQLQRLAPEIVAQGNVDLEDAGNALVGVDVTVNVEQEDYDGITRAKVKSFRRAV